MESSTENLPQIGSLSPSVLSFLNATFHPAQDILDLGESTRLVTELEDQCSRLSQLLSDLMQRLDASLLSYASFSDRVGANFNKSNCQFEDLKSKLSPFCTTDRREKKLVADELGILAKQVLRVEMVRNYAETALKLDSLVGEIEDDVSSVMNKKLKKHSIPQSSEELLVTAIESLKSIEDVLASVTKAHPQWIRLVLAADHRVDRALATLRPQAIADHRALLASFGWPPPLSTLSSSHLVERTRSHMSNPLSEIHGELKKKYCESFIALCRLQELQRRRKFRNIDGYKYNYHRALHQPLWGIEELVNPLFLASHHHLKSWIDKPEFAFTLVYKLIRDHIDSIDELLQPLVDEAMLTGYSCREEWISSMVMSLTTYLAKEVFPSYITPLTEESVTDVQLQSKTALLHIIDLMISFDKRIRALSSQSGLLVSVEDYRLLQRMSCLSVFSDRPDWLDVWAEIELGSILDILKPEIEDERNWTTKSQGAPFLGSEDFKSPGISSLFLRHVSSVIDRCRSLPTVFLRSRFIRLVDAQIIQTLLNTLLTKCLEAEGLTALASDDALAKVTTSINCTHHLESVLKEWCEDVFFLEMGLEQDDQSESSIFTGITEGVGNGVFDEEIRKMEEFRKEWIDKVVIVILRGFDSQIRDYQKNKKQWQEKLEEGLTVSKSFVVGLDYLQGKMSIIEQALNRIDFATVWRSLAHGIDRLIYTGILTGNIKFSGGGVERFRGDMDVLFGVFKAWCLRPEGFFPHISEGLKVLMMEENHARNFFKEGEEAMKRNGIRHLSLIEVEKIARSRVFL